MSGMERRWVRSAARLLVVCAAMAALGGCWASGGAIDGGVEAGDVGGSRVREAADGVHSLRRVDTGRFRIGIELGMVGVQVLDTEIVGSFDRPRGAVEVELDMRDLDSAMPPGSELLRPQGLLDHMVIRAVDGLVLVHLGLPDREWVAVAGSLDSVLAGMPVHHPDSLLELLEPSGRSSVQSVEPGEEIDGRPTTRLSGWIDGAALGRSPDVGSEALGVVAGVAPTELVDRLVRFDLWVDGVGVPRRLVIELDHETVAEVARRVDGTSEGVDRLLMRYVVDWFDLDTPVDIVMPPPDEVSVVDVVP